ncbi:MAG: thioredoxin [Thermoprotei archaeon]
MTESNDESLEIIKSKMLSRMLKESIKKGSTVVEEKKVAVKPIKLDMNNFDEVIHNNKVVFVDFWAAWCGPCILMAPTVEELARKYAGKVVVGKLNVDENRAIAYRYNIMGIPTFMIFYNGEPVERIVGATSIVEFERVLAPYLNNDS